jgi:restriction system protein
MTDLSWKDYQEEVAAFFRSIGLNAETDVSLQGVRTKHDVDVLVKSTHAGFEIVWIVECKQWTSKVSKLHVLALREIVSDLGADRGILMAENGFQSGALEAAILTNVHVTSLSELSSTASNEIFSMRLREIYDRLLLCKEEYWSIPKQKRIECDLRQEAGTPGYYGDRVIGVLEGLITKTFSGVYPIDVDGMSKFIVPELPTAINSAEELVKSVEPLIIDLENRLAKCKESLKPEA